MRRKGENQNKAIKTQRETSDANTSQIPYFHTACAEDARTTELNIRSQESPLILLAPGGHHFIHTRIILNEENPSHFKVRHE